MPFRNRGRSLARRPRWRTGTDPPQTVGSAAYALSFPRHPPSPMPRILTLSDAALRDLKAIREWLRQPGSGAVAMKRLANIRSAVLDLRETPCTWPESDHSGVRERPIAGYMVFYEVAPDTGDNLTAGDVHVLRVFG